eukprot:2234850-Rhodomonas_salina.1
MQRQGLMIANSIIRGLGIDRVDARKMGGRAALAALEGVLRVVARRLASCVAIDGVLDVCEKGRER